MITILLNHGIHQLISPVPASIILYVGTPSFTVRLMCVQEVLYSISFVILGQTRSSNPPVDYHLPLNSLGLHPGYYCKEVLRVANTQDVFGCNCFHCAPVSTSVIALLI